MKTPTPRLPTRRLLTAAVAAALAAGLVAALPMPATSAQERPSADPPQAPADPQQAPPEPARGPKPGRGPRVGARHAAMRDGRGRVRRRQNADARARLGRELAITDDQRRVFLEKARAAEPLVAQWRKDVARQRVERESAPAPATPEDRTARRASNRTLRDKLAADLSPLAKDVVATLTPEQRARIEGFAAGRGRRITADQLERRAARLLARPMTVPMLEARLERR